MASEDTSPGRHADLTRRAAGRGRLPVGWFASRSDRPAGRSGRVIGFLLLISLGLTALIAVPGCSGCRPDPNAAKKKEEEEKKKKKKEKPKPDFYVGRLRLQPFDENVINQQGKWGHWSSAVQPMKANNFDFQGELVGATVGVSNDTPYTLERTPFRMRSWRRASLPKGQTKYLETTYFFPRLADRMGKSVGLSTQLRVRGGGREVWAGKELPKPMPAHQYDMVVLARQSDRYAMLKRLNSVLAPYDDFAVNPPGPYYRVLLPKITEKTPVPLPSQPLVWTTIAYVVWDDVSPEVLSLDQRRAMIDWLHWGGQIIVSGPATLDTLRGSFLGEYLPAEPGDSVQLTQAAFDPLNEKFKETRLLGGVAGYRPLEVVEGTWVEGIALKKHAEAEFMPSSGELLVERRVGRGRIVITAFPLTDRRITNWQSFDNFFNAYLLRRPPRRFGQTPNLGLRVDWAEPHAGKRLDARLVSNVRYFTRDAGTLLRRSNTQAEVTGADETPADEFAGFAVGETNYPGDFSYELDDPAATEDEPPAASPPPTGVTWDIEDKAQFDNGFRASPHSGVAGWTDLGGTPDEVRLALKQAAGISVPKATFVIRVLSVYLVVLVPLNWLIFRLIGRVEWAWLAAPVIAIGGAVAVVYMAQLDIGFVRSRTEMSVLELQGGYHRGHLTRYTALYSSLSTNYDFFFDEPSALAQPFAADPNYERLVGQRVHDVTFSRDQQVRLSGFPVQSNSTGMLHSEHMLPLGGGVQLRAAESGRLELANDTTLTLRGTGLIRRVADSGPNALEVAWIGELKPQMRAAVRFAPVRDKVTLLPEWNDTPETALGSQMGQLSIRRLLDMAQDPRRIANGDVRLVAWTDQALPGLDIRPRSRMESYRTLVLGHLQYAPLAVPEVDENSSRDIKVDDTWVR